MKVFVHIKDEHQLTVILKICRHIQNTYAVLVCIVVRFMPVWLSVKSMLILTTLSHQIGLN
jgi:hypothetical protein